MRSTESTQAMAQHAVLIGVAAFLYMGFFGHWFPTELRGPFVRKRLR